MAAPLLRTVRPLPSFRLEMRMPRLTTEIVPGGLISAKTFNYLSRLGTFLRGTLLSTEKPVKTQRLKYSPKGVWEGSDPGLTHKKRRKHVHSNKSYDASNWVVDAGIAQQRNSSTDNTDAATTAAADKFTRWCGVCLD